MYYILTLFGILNTRHNKVQKTTSSVSFESLQLIKKVTVCRSIVRTINGSVVIQWFDRTINGSVFIPKTEKSKSSSRDDLGHGQCSNREVFINHLFSCLPRDREHRKQTPGKNMRFNHFSDFSNVTRNTNRYLKLFRFKDQNRV